jgi:hypothetical protein
VTPRGCGASSGDPAMVVVVVLLLLLVLLLQVVGKARVILRPKCMLRCSTSGKRSRTNKLPFHIMPNEVLHVLSLSENPVKTIDEFKAVQGMTRAGGEQGVGGNCAELYGNEFLAVIEQTRRQDSEASRSGKPKKKPSPPADLPSSSAKENPSLASILSQEEREDEELAPTLAADMANMAAESQGSQDDYDSAGSDDYDNASSDDYDNAGSDDDDYGEDESDGEDEGEGDWQAEEEKENPSGFGKPKKKPALAKKKAAPPKCKAVHEAAASSAKENPALDGWLLPPQKKKKKKKSAPPALWKAVCPTPRVVLPEKSRKIWMSIDG